MTARAGSLHDKKSRTGPGQIQGTTTLLTIPEVAAELRCSKDKVYDEIAAGRLVAVDLRGERATRSKARVTREALAEYVAKLPTLGLAS